MVVQSHFVFGRDIKEAGVRKEEYCNSLADVCSIDISGDFSGEITVEGKLDKNGENYITLTGIDLSSFSLNPLGLEFSTTSKSVSHSSIIIL